jgi:hypothetical protein
MGPFGQAYATPTRLGAVWSRSLSRRCRARPESFHALSLHVVRFDRLARCIPQPAVQPHRRGVAVPNSQRRRLAALQRQVLGSQRTGDPARRALEPRRLDAACRLAGIGDASRAAALLCRTCWRFLAACTGSEASVPHAGRRARGLADRAGGERRPG